MRTNHFAQWTGRFSYIPFSLSLDPFRVSECNNLPSWVTPTSYGAVITQIDSKKNLNRVYLNLHAVNALLSDGKGTVMKSLEEKGLQVLDMGLNIDRLREDVKNLSLCPQYN